MKKAVLAIIVFWLVASAFVYQYQELAETRQQVAETRQQVAEVEYELQLTLFRENLLAARASEILEPMKYAERFHAYYAEHPELVWWAPSGLQDAEWAEIYAKNNRGILEELIGMKERLEK